MRHKNWSEGYSDDEMRGLIRREGRRPQRRGRSLRKQFELLARKQLATRIPDHLRMRDFTLCFCHGLTAAPGHENWNAQPDYSEIQRRIAALTT